MADLLKFRQMEKKRKLKNLKPLTKKIFHSSLKSKMLTKRLRIIADPNGSGKTTLIERIKNNVHLGVFINADEIESIIKKTTKLSFSAY